MRIVGVHVGLFVALVTGAVVTHGAVHATGWDSAAGAVGTLLIVASFVYSLRKRKRIRRGKPTVYLRAHEILAWTGALLVLVHGGAHFQSVLPWAAQAALLVAVASGLIGKYLLRRSRRALDMRRSELAAQGLERAQIEDRVYWDALLVGAMKRWRDVHIPITVGFAVLAGLHIVSALLFWRW